MGWLSDAWDAVTDAADAVGDAVSDVAGSAWDAATDAADAAWGAATTTVGSAGGWLGDAIAVAAEAVDTATFGLAGQALEAADDYVFDTVDYVTGGAIDIDFDDGRFTVGAGFDGLASVGASIGEEGIALDGTIPGADLAISLTDAGFGAAASAGIDWGPLPFAEAHIEVSPAGDVLIDGELQGTIPTPVGLLSGEVSGGFVQTADGWGAYVDAEGTLLLPSGTTIGGGLEAAYSEDASGSHLEVGVDASISVPGVISASAGVDYVRDEVDGDVTHGVHAEVSASAYGVELEAEADYIRQEVDGDVVEAFHAEGSIAGYGAEVSAEADYVAVEVDGVSASAWETDVDVELPDLPGLPDLTEPAPAPEPEPAPVEAFDHAIETAEQVESSVDDLFQDF